MSSRTTTSEPASYEVRNGFSAIRVRFTVDGDADAKRAAALVAQSVRRSAVYDVITNGTDVSVEVA